MVLDEAGTGLPKTSVAKSTVAVLLAGLPWPTTFIVTSLVMVAFIASGVGLGEVGPDRLPAPEPLLVMVEETN